MTKTHEVTARQLRNGRWTYVDRTYCSNKSWASLAGLKARLKDCGMTVGKVEVLTVGSLF